MKILITTATVLFGCTASEKVDTASSDLCAGIDLPECPAECPEDFANSCGEECQTEGEECGNSIGDGRICTDGLWQCTVHAPLEPDQCNLICQ